jgi:acyl-homoserine-lactone acylase
VDGALLDRCRLDVAGLPGRLVVLDGSTSECEWRVDPRSKVAGALPPADMPRITRDDYVTNSNDSYWLANPQAPLEGYSPIIGNERTARSLRTRAGLTLMEEMIADGGKVSPADIQNMLYSHRNFAAELLLDDVLTLCDDKNLDAVCAVLSQWDRTMNVDSRGGHLWREFWSETRAIDNLYAVKFDASDPVHTPRDLNVADAAVAQALTTALLDAEKTLTEAGIALDAPLGEIQYAQRNGRNVPIPGGEGWAGMFSMIVTRLNPETGYNPITHGNSYIQVISWDEDGMLDPRAMLTYSQSPEPESAHYSDLTEIYSDGGWITLPFTETQITADPNLRRMHLTQ